MARMALALCQKHFNRPLRSLLPSAAKSGAAGLELLASGAFSPQQLTASARREVRHLVTSQQLAITALEVPLRFGLSESENQEARIDYLRQAMTLSFDLGCRTVVVTPGPIPIDEKDPRRTTLIETLGALGEFGDRIGATLALETGIDAPETLDALLARFDSGSLAVAFHPGLYLVHGHDPYAALRTLRSRIRVVHAGDARRGLAPRMVPVGRGDLDWLELVSIFAEIEYSGFLTVAVEPGANAETDATAGLAFLKRLIVS